MGLARHDLIEVVFTSSCRAGICRSGWSFASNLFLEMMAVAPPDQAECTDDLEAIGSFPHSDPPWGERAETWRSLTFIFSILVYIEPRGKINIVEQCIPLWRIEIGGHSHKFRPEMLPTFLANVIDQPEAQGTVANYRRGGLYNG